MGSCFQVTTYLKTIHTDIATSNIEEPHQKNRLGTVSNRLLGERAGA